MIAIVEETDATPQQRAIREIKRDGRWRTLLTYADESQGHTGLVYRAAGWQYLGRTKPAARWVHFLTGRQMSKKSTRTRTDAEMPATGAIYTGAYCKHKYVLRLRSAR